TIDLGFAHLDLQGIGRVGIVDVPGHERFVRNMVAGATGMDLVLLVVAADDGVMPQTREHLDIVRLLGVGRMVVALTKIDLVPAQQVETARAEIQELLRDTPFSSAPIVPVSAVTGAGLEPLRAALASALGEIQPARREAYFRLAIDRVFTAPGFGGVVTGTIASGEVRPGDAVRLLPGGTTARVRGLQSHNEPVEIAVAGSRAALNLAGLDKDALRRGMMVCDPCLTSETTCVDASVTLTEDCTDTRRTLRVRVHSGTAEALAQLVWLDEPPRAYQPALAQLRLKEPMALLYGDRFILRGESAQRTLGGGVALDPFAARRGAREPQHLALLRHLERLNPEESLQAWLEARGEAGWHLEELAERLAVPTQRLKPLLEGRTDLWREEQSGVLWVALRGEVEALLPRLREDVGAYLREHPRATAMAPATLQAKICPRLEPHIFRALVARLVTSGALERVADGLRLPGHRQQFTPEEQALAARFEAALSCRGNAPPRLEALAREVNMPLPRLTRFLGELARAGRVVPIARDIYLLPQDMERWRGQAVGYLERHGRMTLPQFRDEIGVGRELALKVLEHFDRTGVTRRDGDARVRATASASVARA
ncbi:MAG TPA: selenocysteine-specific translation elongation factor, partial [Thiobacillus sp.]|nr:selenocysteine-specific translation elongation factor [Thiobacillus sp.]